MSEVLKIVGGLFALAGLSAAVCVAILLLGSDRL